MNKTKNLIDDIFNEINNCNVTQKNLARKYNLNERTIRRYFKKIKDSNLITYDRIQKKWIIK